jgi:cytochrome c peroxidase
MSTLRLLLTAAFTLASSSALIAQGPPPPLGPPPVPPGNPLTVQKANLGQVLFWDEQLSSNRTVACGTCHVVSQGGSDPRTSAANPASRHPGPDGQLGTPDDKLGSPGTSRLGPAGNYLLDPLFRLAPQVGTRKAPSVLNAAYAPEQFWDGRAPGEFRDPLTHNIVLPAGASLESQVLGPPVNPVEMAHQGRDWNQVAGQIANSIPLRLAPAIPAGLAAWIAGRSYPQLFHDVFGTSGVTPVRIAEAIASYERTLWTGQAPIDAFFGGQQNALTQQELAGQAVFTGPGQCVVCHAGNLFTNHSFRYTGVRPPPEDEGRFLVTGAPGDHGRMKVPSLRNVELRAPYFHNGEMATLEDVIEFYDRGGDFDAPNLDPAIHPLNLSAQQKADLAAFLRRPLTDPRVLQASGPFAHPALFSGSALALQPFGHGTPGSAGVVPAMVALEPPFVGNPHLGFAIDHARAGRVGVLVVGNGSLPNGAPFFGTDLFVDLAGPHLILRVPPLAGSGGDGGFGSAWISIAPDPLLVGVPLYAQWLVFDSTPGVCRFSATVPVGGVRF